MKIFTLLFFVVLLVTKAQAQTYTEVFRVDYDGVNQGHNVYVETNLSFEDSFFVNSYKDDEYASTFVGPAKKFGDLQVGFGVGEAKYFDTDGKRLTSFAYNPFLYFERGKFIAYGELEYLRDDRENYYYRGYITRSVWNAFGVGMYTERWIGTGPMLNIAFDSENSGLNFSVVKPVFNVPSIRDEKVGQIIYANAWVKF